MLTPHQKREIQDFMENEYLGGAFTVPAGLAEAEAAPALSGVPPPVPAGQLANRGIQGAATELIPTTPVAALHYQIERAAETAAQAVGVLRRIVEEQAAFEWPDHKELQSLSAHLLRETEDFNGLVYRLHLAVTLKTCPP